MKPIYCTECGDEIQHGYAINPENSEVCEECYQNNLEEV